MGYHQNLIALIDRIKTAFWTPNGMFQFNLMPFGLCNAPATFQRLMDDIFHSDLLRDIVAYLDDLLIYGTTLDKTLDS